MRTHTKFGIKIFEIDFVNEIKWYLTLWPLPKERAPKKFYVARPIHVSNSHPKFGWILSNGLGGDSITDRQMSTRTDWGDNNIPFAKSVGIINILKPEHILWFRLHIQTITPEKCWILAISDLLCQSARMRQYCLLIFSASFPLPWPVAVLCICMFCAITQQIKTCSKLNKALI